MTDEDFIESCNYTVMMLDLHCVGRVLHMVAYPESPSETDIELLIKEFSEDETLGLSDLTHLVDYALVVLDVNPKDIEVVRTSIH